MLINYLVFPKINPVIFTIGPISFYWYGFMYFISFLFVMCFLRYRIKSVNSNWTKREIEHLLFMSFWGVVLGGRIGYILFYAYNFYFENIFFLFKIWEGGMSFHGGLIGVIVVLIWFSYSTKRNFFQVSDFVIPAIPFGLGAGRLGNFINGELWGRVTINTPWAMLFPNARDQDILLASSDSNLSSLFNYYGMLPRHPSQLYEMFLEGVFLFIMFNFLIKKSLPVGTISGLFLFFYGVIRVIVEFFRQPDFHLGLFQGLISMGQILSFPMIVIGIAIIVLSYYRYL
ncbi:prolipoprotein diacylglyceryl transferase [Blochmannia endosymbiont of Camponotus (Colobopsis) obliquus]|uniref:prolipoprotein diacylglyceryl transferase n=1 Tax=Blochmannia endosymbiont of Camponotus (Colobopsis) obliquus TaxID=1505597 RepID=UPI00061A5A68|nr:prolipoprotein diacylglyceryl transferase [Blochmannia endosymbiont of Camponotus (Colobopsis) obliquus]AKC60431.1 prolipoprotein diacylglyceryl transferase [Blochmannia endosymbiont of Camponotus (Colobopsis) obliquus]